MEVGDQDSVIYPGLGLSITDCGSHWNTVRMTSIEACAKRLIRLLFWVGHEHIVSRATYRTTHVQPEDLIVTEAWLSLIKIMGKEEERPLCGTHSLICWNRMRGTILSQVKHFHPALDRSISVTPTLFPWGAQIKCKAHTKAFNVSTAWTTERK